jgi:GT2 family glycosyltransferase
VAEHIEHAVIGYCHPGTVRAEFCASLVATAMEGKTPLDAVLTLASGPNISTARNRIVADFLTRQHAPWLLMVDTDMVFAGDALDRLIAAAHPVERPILGGLCFSQDGDTSYPVMYELGETKADPSRSSGTRPGPKTPASGSQRRVRRSCSCTATRC